MQIQGQTALVTGAGSGPGEAVARELHRQGARVALVDLDGSKVDRLADELGRDRALALVADVADTAQLGAALDACEASIGAPRIVMNVAGIGPPKRILSKDGNPAPLEDFERVPRINLTGTYNVIRLATARIARLAPLEDDERASW